VVKHLLHDARKSMVNIFDNCCALVNKNGTFHQCSELNGIFNPEQDARQALLKIEMVKTGFKGLYYVRGQGAVRFKNGAYTSVREYFEVQ